MKNKQLVLPKILLLFGLFFLIPNHVEGQFLKKLKEKAEKKIEREAEKRTERRMNKKIDKEFDKAEDVLDGKKKNGEKDENGNANQNSQENNQNSENTSELNGTKVKKPNVVWSRFDFVPGDTVIFEDGPSMQEENGEFPSRWDIFSGNSEIINVDGENVIAFPKGGNIVPYLKDSKNDYLPEIFTIELDAWFSSESNQRNLNIYFYDRKNQKAEENYQSVGINSFSAEYDVSFQEIPRVKHNGMWRHISIAYTKGKLKVYLDETRLINVPHMKGNPTGVTLNFYGYSGDQPNELQYIKNIRIAKGGVKYYDRFLSEGKIVVNGIKFDVNKATLKAESMGPINEIYDLMQKNPDINFSVEGHTDSDGDDASNMTLSKARGKSVMDKLIEMGISANRLKSDGFGESKPIDNNSTPEGKANNRRVEFVKFSGTTSTNSNTHNNNNNNSSSSFNELDKNTIAAKLESLPDSFRIPISNKSGIVNGQGTVILYATTNGKFGKMEILDVNEENNYELTLKYVTYNYDGSVFSQVEKLQVEGTYGCELDNGYSGDVDYEDAEFFLGRQGSVNTSLNPTETVILKVYK